MSFANMKLIFRVLMNQDLPDQAVAYRIAAGQLALGFVHGREREAACDKMLKAVFDRFLVRGDHLIIDWSIPWLEIKRCGFCAEDEAALEAGSVLWAEVIFDKIMRRDA